MKIELSAFTIEEIDTIYSWKLNELHHENFTCRPVKKIGSIEEYKINTINWINTSGNVFLLLRNLDTAEVIGEIKGFDLNIRNNSMEFGFFIPEQNRSFGYGTLMVEMFLKYIFNNNGMNIYKLYATTADNNEASKKVLIKNGLSLDGRNREHYWINENKYDQLVYSILKKEWEGKEKI